MSGPSLAIRSQVPNATVDNDGLMTKEQVVQLNNASGGGITLPLDEDLTFTPGGKSIEILANTTDGDGSSLTINPSSASGEADADGGDVNLSFSSGVGAGRDGRVNVGSNDIVMEKQPAFGAAHIHGKLDGGGLYVTGDGVGPLRGGTGIACLPDSVDPTQSATALFVNDTIITLVDELGILPVSSVTPEIDIGGPDATRQSFRRAWLQIYGTRVGPAIASAATISPTYGVHTLTGSVAVTTVNQPFTGFTGAIDLCVVDGCTVLGVAVAAGKSIRLVSTGATWYPNG